MPRIDRAECPTVQANDARDLTRSGRVALSCVDDPGIAADAVYAVRIDGEPAGLVILYPQGWVAARPGWRDYTHRPKRHAAVRRLVMSYPRGAFASPANQGRDTP